LKARKKKRVPTGVRSLKGWNATPQKAPSWGERAGGEKNRGNGQVLVQRWASAKIPWGQKEGSCSTENKTNSF